MNTNKYWKRLLMAGMLLGLLMTAACGMKEAIKGPEEQALAAQGDVVMATLKDGDFQAVQGLMSPEVQKMLDSATSMVSSWVDLESLIMQNAPAIATWKFDQARIYTRDGALIGKLDGTVAYADGKASELSLELEKDQDAWKLRSFSLEK